MGLIDRINTFLSGGRAITFTTPGATWDNILPYVTMGGNSYALTGLDTSMPYARFEEPGRDFAGLVAAGYQGNGVVFACELTRIQVFSQARFQWQSFVKGQPNKLYGTPALDVLSHPWRNATTGDLLTRMLLHADFGGNAFVTPRRAGLKCMRPDWVYIIHGSPNNEDVLADDLDAELLGYAFFPGGRSSGRPATFLLPEKVAHFAPIPDPTSPARGMSWMSPIVREVMADGAANAHKLRFFENGATANLVIKRNDTPSKVIFDEWVKLMNEGHTGAANAYRTLYLTSGMDATVIGSDFRQMDFKITQGAGETRVAAAAGTHPVIVGLSEGMQGSSLNAGNFNSARRLMADKTLWHLWSNAAGSLETIAPPPAGSRLWVDDRGIPFLREDRKDAAEIQQIKATTINTYITGGFTPESAVAAADNEDASLLKHTGLVSVQLQPPGTTAPKPDTAPTNGTKPVAGAKP